MVFQRPKRQGRHLARMERAGVLNIATQILLHMVNAHMQSMRKVPVLNADWLATCTPTLAHTWGLPLIQCALRRGCRPKEDLCFYRSRISRRIVMHLSLQPVAASEATTTVDVDLVESSLLKQFVYYQHYCPVQRFNKSFRFDSS